MTKKGYIDELNSKKNNNFNQACIDQVNQLIYCRDKRDYSKSDHYDLTHLKTFTIDDESTYERDDAISIQSRQGHKIIWIHISSPSLYIEYDSPLEREARKRISSIYLPDRTITMFPKEVINNLLSLNSGSARKTISIGVELKSDGSIKDYQLRQSIVTCNYNLTYDDAEELIELAPKEEEDLSILHRLLIRRRNYRLSNGALSIENEEGRISMNAYGKLYIKYMESMKSRIMISEAMVLFGSIIAIYAKQNNISIPYRCQAKSHKTVEPKLFENTNKEKILQKYNQRTNLMASYISTIPNIHSNLAINPYCQSSSPIRRYNDLLIHYQINNFINHKDLLDDVDIDSHIERIRVVTKEINQITRSSELYWLNNWFSSKENKSYSVYFLRWIRREKQICLVHLIELSLELTIRISNLVDLEFGQEYTIVYCDLFDESEFIMFNMII